MIEKITNDRLDELERLGPAEACLFKAELKELIDVYRKARKQKPLFEDIIALHPGLAEELKAIQI